MKSSIFPPSFLVRPSVDDPRPLILYHGRNCSDGFGAALAAWLFYGPEVEMRGLDLAKFKALMTWARCAGARCTCLILRLAPS